MIRDIAEKLILIYILRKQSYMIGTEYIQGLVVEIEKGIVDLIVMYANYISDSDEIVAEIFLEFYDPEGSGTIITQGQTWTLRLCLGHIQNEQTKTDLRDRFRTMKKHPDIDPL